MTAIDDARSLLKKRKSTIAQDCRIDFYQDGRDALGLLPALISEAEKWQQIAIAERAQRRLVAKYMLIWREDHRKEEEDTAARELATEAGTWRHIGPAEQVAIQEAALEALKRGD